MHDASCESELTSHGYTPCRCEERAALRGTRDPDETALLRILDALVETWRATPTLSAASCASQLEVATTALRDRRGEARQHPALRRRLLTHLHLPLDLLD